jgi:hypothetical protein
MRSASTPIGVAPVATASILAAALATASFAYLPPTAKMTFSVNNGPPTVLDIVGTTTLSGNHAFVKTVIQGTNKVTFNYVADINPLGNAVINGSTTFENTATVSVAASTSFAVSICPTVTASLVGGIASAKLICNADGGILTCGPGTETLAAAVSDGLVVQPLYYCPFELTKTGAGSSTTNMNFGLPIPALDGPGELGSLGHSANFILSPGDKVIFTLMYATNGNIVDPLLDPCPGDVNGDGVVNKDDLMEVLAGFGQQVACGNPIDADANGWIDAADLGLVTGSWGDCADQ